MKEIVDLEPFDRQWCPEPLFEKAPDLIDLYWRAWEMAWQHVKGCKGAPQSPFMDEGFSDSAIWIWDTCFMVHFCKYAPDKFPGIQSFENFYQCMHDGRSLPLKIHHPDNPPLFAWIEHDYYLLTGDSSRLSRIVSDKRYLQKHFQFIENSQPGTLFSYANFPMTVKREALGYRWDGCPNGMDNTPRGGDDYGSIYWVDLIAQQALAADHIGQVAALDGEWKTVDEFGRLRDELTALLNRHYWDEDTAVQNKWDLDKGC